MDVAEAANISNIYDKTKKIDNSFKTKIKNNILILVKNLKENKKNLENKIKDEKIKDTLDKLQNRLNKNKEQINIIEQKLYDKFQKIFKNNQYSVPPVYY